MMSLDANKSARLCRRNLRRETILALVEEEFLEHSFSRTTMTSIAKKLGGSKTTLWSYFKSKDELLEAVVQRASVKLAMNILHFRASETTLDQFVLNFCQSYVHRICTPWAVKMHRLVLSEIKKYPTLKTSSVKN